MSKRFFSQLTLLVDDYDKAIQFYVTGLGFALLEDKELGEGKRWVRVAPEGAQTALLLVKAKTDPQLAQVGCQAGGKVLLFLQTDDFWADYERMAMFGVVFLEEPREEKYATVVVFQDPFGNKWDLLQVNEG